MTIQYPFVRELYDAFQSLEVDRWDALVAEEVLIHSTMGRNILGRDALKSWAKEFIEALQSRIDLVDEFEAIEDVHQSVLRSVNTLQLFSRSP